MAARPWDPAVQTLIAVVGDWLDQLVDLRPARQRKRLARLLRALGAAEALSRDQTGAASSVTRRYADLLAGARAARSSPTRLAALRDPISEALGGLSSAIAHLAPEIKKPCAGFDAEVGTLGAVVNGGTWIDLGCGDGASLAGLAERFADARFVGVDFEGVAPTVNLVALPREPDPARLSALTIERLGRSTAEAVTLLYPLHAPLTPVSGERRLAHTWQLDTALALLSPGGRGLLVTEDPVAWGVALGHLRGTSTAEVVSPLPLLVGRRQLRDHGILPYAPSARDVGRPTPRFTWGLALFFSRKLESRASVATTTEE